MLKEYRLFALNSWGVIDSARAMLLRDDETAFAQARAMYHPGPVEVWSGARRLTVVPPAIDRGGAGQRTTH